MLISPATGHNLHSPGNSVYALNILEQFFRAICIEI